MRYVAGMPIPIFDNHEPYHGPHPSLQSRPNDPVAYPIAVGDLGPVEPLFAGSNRYPFQCGTWSSGLGQPTIDNQQGWGQPVYATDKQGNLTKKIIGYSKDCSAPVRVNYYFQQRDTGKFLPLDQARDDIQQISLGGDLVDFIVRVEMGTINRFIYVIAVVSGFEETPDKPSVEHWNKRLIYQFRGGVGIGFRQGKVSGTYLLKNRHEELAKGYGVVYSSGTHTSNHYDMWLAEDTALRVKKQFIARYGEPDYTVGIGGSGGAIQQYLLAQNNPDIIDAAIAEYSYPDMLTQTLYGFDCELTEYYFDVVDRDNSRWKDWSSRQLIQGTNAKQGVDNKFSIFHRLSLAGVGFWPTAPRGNSECVNGWRGLTPLVNNPRFAHFNKDYAKAVRKNTRWSYWDSLKYLYGTDEKGLANSTYDNTGVQYGLQALVDRHITLDDFLKLNASVGGWKPRPDMKQENFWFLSGDKLPFRISVWSHHNMMTGSLHNPAVREKGSIEAMQAAYRSGHIFLGKLDIPVIDVRHYLEEQLDMHHVSASFSARARMQREQGHADNQVIWMTHKPHNPEPLAFEVIDRWMSNIHQNPDKTVAENRPPQAVDQCMDKNGDVIAAGQGVWDGGWNYKPVGRCSEVYPTFSTSRIVAGDSIAADTLKCHLQPVEDAISNGVYGDIDVSNEVERLKKIFPDGVCDYLKGDMGRPGSLLVSAK